MTIIVRVGDIRETLSCWSNLYPVYLCRVTDPCVRGSSSVSREDDVKCFYASRVHSIRCLESVYRVVIRDNRVQEFSHGLSYVSTIGASLNVASPLAINSTALCTQATQSRRFNGSE